MILCPTNGIVETLTRSNKSEFPEMRKLDHPAVHCERTRDF
jgi:hypothetical protein